MPFMIAAGIGAGGSLINGLLSRGAAKSAAGAQEAAANNATNAELSMFNTAQSDLSPYMQGGANAFSALQKAMGIGPGGGGATNPILQMLGIGPNGQPTGGGIDPSTFISSPGYQFQLQQGEDAVTNSAAARGGLGGNALKAIQNYGSGLANQSWQQYLGNVGGGWNSLISSLTNMSNTGLNAGDAMAGNAMRMGAMEGSNIIDAGTAKSAGIVSSNNALTGGINNALQSIMGGLTGGGGSNVAALLNGGGYVDNGGWGTGGGLGL